MSFAFISGAWLSAVMHPPWMLLANMLKLLAQWRAKWTENPRVGTAAAAGSILSLATIKPFSVV